jgi:hypothetical protein
MGTWTTEELDRIGEAEELLIAPVRRDGTQRTPVIVWVAREGDNLYVRSVHGRTAAWFRAAQERHEAHIEAGGVDRDVVLVETDDGHDEIDAVYRAKYHGHPQSDVDGIVTPSARAAMLRLVPR